MFRRALYYEHRGTEFFIFKHKDTKKQCFFVNGRYREQL